MLDLQYSTDFSFLFSVWASPLQNDQQNNGCYSANFCSFSSCFELAEESAKPLVFPASLSFLTFFQDLLKETILFHLRFSKTHCTTRSSLSGFDLEAKHHCKNLPFYFTITRRWRRFFCSVRLFSFFCCFDRNTKTSSTWRYSAPVFCFLRHLPLSKVHWTPCSFFIWIYPFSKTGSSYFFIIRT